MYSKYEKSIKIVWCEKEIEMKIFNILYSTTLAVLMCNMFCGFYGEPIEEVDDSDLVHLLTSENNVIVLFTKDNCKICREWEMAVERLQKDLKDSLEAVTVKAHNSHMINIYDPSKEPALIYFRRGIPLLYHGEIDEEEILQTFSDNQDPVVRELSDINFEKLTQASTGATTGDWFIFFYSADCVHCQHLYAVWEAVGSKLKHRLNVARMNRLDAGMSTAKRLGITMSPEFILLRLGKIYRYKKQEFTPKSFIEFAENKFQDQRNSEPVPAVSTIWDDYISGYIQFFSESSYIVIVGVIVLCSCTYVFVNIIKRPKQILKKHKM